jgi:erythromycin esterase-like protein
MWRNWEVADLVAWMRRRNEGLDPSRMAGFFGLDMYNMGGSISAVLDYLDRVDPEAAKVARDRYGCLHPWHGEPAQYGRAVLTEGYRRCEKAVVAQWRDLLEKRLGYVAEGGDEFLDAERNASLVASAERYYRIMYYGDAQSWNLRDGHMFETLQSLLDARGSDSRAVVWAHNSHIGDAATPTWAGAASTTSASSAASGSATRRR